MSADFEIIDVLHHSSEVKVLRANRKHDDLPVIMKVLETHGSVSKLEYLSQEYNLALKLPSTITPKPLAFELIDKNHTAVYEDDGLMGLSNLLPPTGFDELDVIAIGIKLCDVLIQIHDLSIIHCDINPSNIIVSTDLEQLKLIDFEFSSELGRQEVDFDPPTLLQGTLGYISPEQTGRINKPVDHRSDLYALGATLYELCCGHTVFNETDPAKLIYAHIAKNPAQISEMKPSISQVLSSIIHKLLMKEPEVRYQQASTVKKDLLQIQKLISQGKTIKEFVPANEDMQHKLRLTSCFLGREEETKTLLDCFEETSKSLQLVSICGRSGVGKSSLIKHLYKSIARENGYFLRGKFDQLSSGLPYTAFVDAFGDFIDQAMAGSKVDELKSRLSVDMADYNAVLADIIPRFTELIGEHQNLVEASGPSRAQRRNLTFVNLLKTISRPDERVTLSLDDLQWADSPSIALLTAIIAESIPNLLIIISYRDNEINLSHRSYDFIQTILSNQKNFPNIRLKPLTTTLVNQWMENLLPNEKQLCEAVTSQLMLRTAGNPFYVEALLRQILERQLITLNNNGKAEANLEEIASLPSESLTGFSTSKIGALEEKPKHLLAQLSILGNRFSRSSIEQLLGLKMTSLIPLLKQLSDEHLITQVADGFVFSHDSVQRTAQLLLGEDEEKMLHLKIARSILAEIKQGSGSIEKTRRCLSHFNHATSLIVDTTEQLDVVNRNLLLARSLRASAAYDLAEPILFKAVELLGDSPFELDHKLTIKIYSELGEVLSYNGNDTQAIEFQQKVLDHAKSPLDKVKVYTTQITHHHASDDINKALDIALIALDEFDIRMPKKFYMAATIRDYAKNKLLLLGKNAEDLLTLPELRDPFVIAQIRLIISSITTIYVAKPEIFACLTLKMMELSYRYGKGEGLIDLSIYYAVISRIFGNHADARDYSELSLRMMESEGDDETKANSYLNYALCLHLCVGSVKELDVYFDRAINGALKYGDYETGALAINISGLSGLCVDQTIDSVLDKYARSNDWLEIFGQDLQISFIKYLEQILLTLQHTKGNGLDLSDAGMAIEKELLATSFSGNSTMFELYYIEKLRLCYLAGEHEKGLQYLIPAMDNINAVTAMIFEITGYFIICLSTIALIRQGDGNDRLKSICKESMRKLKTFSEIAPDNFLSKYLIVKAEFSTVNHSKTGSDIWKPFEVAIKESVEQGYIFEIAIALECYGRHLLRRGQKQAADFQLTQSTEAYIKWGALNKAKRLTVEFSLSSSLPQVIVRDGAPNGTTVLSSDQLNLSALVESIQNLNSGLEQQAVQETLLMLVMENSGATRVVYIENLDDTLAVLAEKRLDDEPRFFSAEKGLLNYHNLSRDLIQQCLTRGNYIVSKMDSDDHRHSSVLLLPLIRSEKIRGIIYLENHHMDDAFREKHLEFLTLLAAQASAALENAQAFSKLGKEKDYSSKIIETSPAMIIGMDSHGIIEFVNPQTVALTEYEEDELIGYDWWEIFFGHNKESVIKYLDAAMLNQDIDKIELMITAKGGKKIDILWSSYIQKDDSNKVQRVIGFVQDITSQNEAKKKLLSFNKELKTKVLERTEELENTIVNLHEIQDKLIESEKLAALGVLVAGVAHEINTPVGVSITGISHLSEQTKLFKKDFKGGALTESSLNRYIETAEKVSDITLSNLKRTSDLVRSFKLISAGEFSDKRQVLPIKRFCRDIASSLKSDLATSHCLVEIDDEKNDFDIDYYPGLLTHIITNLTKNALDHAFIEGQPAEISIGIEISGDTLVIIFGDNGRGIEAENLSKIFEPFFTTNHSGGGIGLGLNVVYNIIKHQLHGEIRCNNKPNSGCYFTITLPLKLESEKSAEVR